jgi:hypothetical protein
MATKKDLASKGAVRVSHLEQPTYWFAVLQIARADGDREAAAEALRQLERLGVQVKFRHPVTQEWV